MKHDTFNIGKKDHYLQGVQEGSTRESLIAHKNILVVQLGKTSIYLLGVTEAYLFYMQREIVRFYQEVQIGC